MCSVLQQELYTGRATAQLSCHHGIMSLQQCHTLGFFKKLKLTFFIKYILLGILLPHSFLFLPIFPPIQIHSLPVSHQKTNGQLRYNNKIWQAKYKSEYDGATKQEKERRKSRRNTQRFRDICVPSVGNSLKTQTRSHTTYAKDL